MILHRNSLGVLTLVVMLVFALAACSDDNSETSPDQESETEPTPTEEQTDEEESEKESEDETNPGEEETSGSEEADQEVEWVNFETEVLATNLDIPWELVFLPNGDMFITERPGTVRLYRDGELQEEPILEFDNVGHQRGAEGGLLGMALHPDFEETNWIYFYYTYETEEDDPTGWRNRVVRYEVDGTEFSDRTVILDDLPGQFTHNGGRIKFGPDDKLYVTLGDAQRQDSAQDPDVLVAKMLRLNDDGSFPEDNPYDDSPVYAIGLRNPQGFDWHPETGELYANQHGPSGNDELNLIEPGNNYGWPDMEGYDGEEKDEFTLPVMASGEETWAPSGATFYDGEVFPQWQNQYLIAGLRSVTLYNVNLDLEEPEIHPILQGMFGRLRTVVQGPDGYLYLLTSNRDERQDPEPEDDRLIRLVPEEE